MDSSIVLARLQSLPRGFRRLGSNYTALENTMMTYLSRYTVAMDSLQTQEYIDEANDSWLNVFGLMFGISRFEGESDVDYLSRIKFTLTCWRGTPAAIVSYLEKITSLSVSVSENTTPEDSWTATLSGTVTSLLVNRINNSIGFVRPAGIPFTYSIATGGLYASTVNYLGRSRMTGSYLISGSKTTVPSVSANTNNSQPSLPTFFLTDVSLNPSS